MSADSAVRVCEVMKIRRKRSPALSPAGASPNVAGTSMTPDSSSTMENTIGPPETSPAVTPLTTRIPALIETAGCERLLFCTGVRRSVAVCVPSLLPKNCTVGFWLPSLPLASSWTPVCDDGCRSMV